MISVNASEAKARLTELVQRAENGEQVIIARRNQPVLELRLLVKPTTKKRPQFGLSAGLFKVPEDFDQPLPHELLDLFEA
jgi:antitoxin (DNA-binding transcriptional repressor) of toxin-antitoxin stability system